MDDSHRNCSTRVDLKKTRNPISERFTSNSDPSDLNDLLLSRALKIVSPTPLLAPLSAANCRETMSRTREGRTCLYPVDRQANSERFTNSKVQMNLNLEIRWFHKFDHLLNLEFEMMLNFEIIWFDKFDRLSDFVYLCRNCDH